MKPDHLEPNIDNLPCILGPLSCPANPMRVGEELKPFNSLQRPSRHFARMAIRTMETACSPICVQTTYVNRFRVPQLTTSTSWHLSLLMIWLLFSLTLIPCECNLDWPRFVFNTECATRISSSENSTPHVNPLCSEIPFEDYKIAYGITQCFKLNPF
jgi:hypothetical protein